MNLLSCSPSHSPSLFPSTKMPKKLSQVTVLFKEKKRIHKSGNLSRSRLQHGFPVFPHLVVFYIFFLIFLFIFLLFLSTFRQVQHVSVCLTPATSAKLFVY